MRTLEEIIKNRRLLIGKITEDGFEGEIQMPTWRGTIICSWGGGWDHVSISPYKKRITPEWEDMCILKDIIFREDEAVIQIHPPKDEYVNNMSNCLHLWRFQDGDMTLPPSFMVGLKKGQTLSDVNREAKAYYEQRGEVW